MLSDDLLDLLRTWWRAGREKGVMLPGRLAVPGSEPGQPPEHTTAEPHLPCRQGSVAEIDKRSACTRCGTALPPTSWSRASTSA